MPSIRLIQDTGLVELGIECLFTPTPGPDEDIALGRAVMVALNTDRLALPDDTLPNLGDDDRRGWWGDLLAAEIWGGWAIGVRLWLLGRAKITDSNAKQGATIERARRYIAECLQPFVDNKFFSRFDTVLQQVGTDRITGTITIYRGPKVLIALEYQEFWQAYGA